MNLSPSPKQRKLILALLTAANLVSLILCKVAFLEQDIFLLAELILLPVDAVILAWLYAFSRAMGLQAIFTFMGVTAEYLNFIWGPYQVMYEGKPIPLPTLISSDIIEFFAYLLLAALVIGLIRVFIHKKVDRAQLSQHIETIGSGA